MGRLDGKNALVTTSSVVASKGFRNRSAYSATKAALRSLARTWTGAIDTPGLKELNLATTDALNAACRDRVPLGRIGQPHDVGERRCVPGIKDSSYITGAEVFVDGGLAQV
jgi:NAD(P)-dependent dehydrogenase (short-subunit alcohol dehydrogenase family)